MESHKLRTTKLQYSLCSLLLLPFLLGSALLLCVNRGPWAIKRVIHENGEILEAGFSPNDRYIFTRSRSVEPNQASEVIRIYDYSSSALCSVLKSNTLPGDDVLFEFSPRETFCFRMSASTAVSSDPHLNMQDIWHVDTASPVYIPDLRSKEFEFSLISPRDSFAILRNSLEGRIVTLTNAKIVAVLPKYASAIFSPDEKWMSYCSNGIVHIVSTQFDGREHVFEGEPGCVPCFSPDNRLLAVNFGVKSKLVTKLVDVESGIEIAKFDGCLKCFASGSKLLVTYNTISKMIFVWDIQSNKILFKCRCADISDVHLSENRLVIDSPVSAYDLNTGALLWRTEIRIAQWSPNGDFAVHRPTDEKHTDPNCSNSIFIFSGITGRPIQQILSASPGLHLRFANNRQAFVTYKDNEKTVQLWRLRRPEFWWGVSYLWEFWLLGLIVMLFAYSILLQGGRVALVGTPTGADRKESSELQRNPAREPSPNDD